MGISVFHILVVFHGLLAINKMASVSRRIRINRSVVDLWEFEDSPDPTIAIWIGDEVLNLAKNGGFFKYADAPSGPFWIIFGSDLLGLRNPQHWLSPCLNRPIAEIPTICWWESRSESNLHCLPVESPAICCRNPHQFGWFVGPISADQNSHGNS